MLADIVEFEVLREALLKARFAGVRTVEYEGRRVTYANDAEMAAALADLDRRIAVASAPRAIRLLSARR